MKLKLCFITLFVFRGIDALWLGLVAPGFHRSQIGHLITEEANLLAAESFTCSLSGRWWFSSSRQP
jgi:uncharacterized membrane protein